MDLNIEALRQTSLFKRQSDYLLFLFLLLMIACFSLLNSYQNYLSFKRFDWYSLDALVISQTKTFRASKELTRYKLKTKTFTFYTTSYKKMIPLSGKKVHVTLKTTNVDFMDFLKGFYSVSKFNGVYHKVNHRYQLLKEIKLLHKNKMMGNLYGALYLAEPIKPLLREKLTHLGINHLAAISGFHLGFISFFLLVILKLFYAPIHQRYLPFRNRTKDMMVVTLLALFVYVAFLNFTPSLLRAFGMMFVGFILYDRGIKLISFSSLAVTLLLLLALFPDLWFALGFWLSALGVFMLFLVLKHFSDIKVWQLFLLLHFSVFILMMPWVAYIFKEISLGMLFSPLLSMLFILFYPLSLIAIPLNLTSFFDSGLIWLLSWEFTAVHVEMTTFKIYLYSGLLIGSLFNRAIFIVTLSLISIWFLTKIL